MKKIVIILESHVDYMSSAAETDLVKHLSSVGFDALGMEFPESGSALKEVLENTIKVSTEQYLYPSLKSLLQTHGLKQINDKPINAKTLLDMNMPELCEVLRQYVSSKMYAEGARIILGIRTTQNKLDMLRTHSNTMMVVGIDPELTFEESKRPTEENYVRREMKMVDRIESLFNKEKRAAHIIGKNHAPGLVKILAERNLLKHTLFLDLHSPATLVTDSPYLTFAQQNRDILHYIMVDPRLGIAPHLANIDTLIGIPPTIVSRQRPS